MFDSDNIIIVPIHREWHWTLAVLTHPGAEPLGQAQAALAAGQTEAAGETVAVHAPAPMAAIVHMDSLTTYHTVAEVVLRNWLAAEWAARRGCDVDAGLRRFASANVPYLRPAVPQQPTSVDCGLFAAEFARRFVDAASLVHTQGGYPYFMRPSCFPRRRRAQPCASTPCRASWLLPAWLSRRRRCPQGSKRRWSWRRWRGSRSPTQQLMQQEPLLAEALGAAAAVRRPREPDASDALPEQTAKRRRSSSVQVQAAKRRKEYEGEPALAEATHRVEAEHAEHGGNSMLLVTALELYYYTAPATQV